MGDSAQYGKTLTHCVGSWAEPFVGQRFPTRVQSDLIGGQQTAQRGDQILGLASGACDSEREPAGARGGGNGERLDRARSGEGE
jgi:hypothetical protein